MIFFIFAIFQINLILTLILFYIVAPLGTFFFYTAIILNQRNSFESAADRGKISR